MADDCKRTLEISIPVEEVEATTRHVVEHLRERVRIPGFRPGKAPGDVIRARFKDEVRQDVLDHLLGSAFQKKAKELSLDVAASPSVSNLRFEEGQPIEFTAEFEVRSEFELQDYSSLTAPYEEPVVTEEDVEARLTALREQRAELVNVDPRPVEEGDFAVISIESLSDIGTAEPIRQDEMNLQVGGEYTLPEFNENVRGMSPGESKEFSVAYPEDYSGQNLAGRTVTYRVSVKGIRKREIPELNDEFAQDMGDYKTADDLRAGVRRAIQEEREYIGRERAKQAIAQSLGESYTFPVPEVYVNQHLENSIRRQMRSLVMQGVDVEKAGIDWQQVISDEREPATKSVRAWLVIERIAAAESISVTEDEVNAEVARVARRERVAPAALRERLAKDGGLNQIAQRIETDKVLDLLFERATKVPLPPPSIEPEGEPRAEEAED